MDPTLLGLGLATLLGLVVGFERERAKELREVGTLGGVRTYALVGLLGGAVVLTDNPALVVAGFLAVAAMALWSLTRAPGATSEVAVLVVYLLGVLAGQGRWQVALFGGLVTLGLLTYRDALHRFVRRVGEEMLEAAVLLALLAGVVGPLLPEGGYGPGGVLRPREIGGMVLLVAAANFLGYVFLRYGRERGLFWAALAGGLVSSTAVTVSMAARARERPQAWRTWAAAAGVATVLMYVRVAVWVGMFAPALLERLLPALGLWALWTLVVAWSLARGGRGIGGELELGNPLGLGAALLFGVFYAGVKLAAYAAEGWLGSAGVYAVAALSGLQDLDAITMSLARLFTQGGLDGEVALRAILLAALVNNAVKAGLGFFGERRMGAALALALLPGALLAWWALG
ncbi:MgtC/SapB family protein [Oceanithermus sp.]